MGVGDAAYEPADRKWSTQQARDLFFHYIKEYASECFDELRRTCLWDCTTIFNDYLYEVAFGLDIWIADKRNMQPIGYTEEVWPIVVAFNRRLHQMFGLSTGVRFMAIGQAERVASLDGSQLFITSSESEKKAVEVPDWEPSDALAPLVANLRQSVLNFTQSWHLSDDWCLGYILDTLYYWSIWYWTEQCDPIQHISLREPLVDGKFVFEHAGWNPFSSQTEEEAKKEIQEAFARHLAIYLNEWRMRLTSHGYVETPNRPALMSHVKWLVQFQVKGWSKSRIAREASTLPKNIRYGLTNAAELIRLTPKKESEI